MKTVTFCIPKKNTPNVKQWNTKHSAIQCRVGAGITDHLSLKLDYSVIQTDIGYLCTHCFTITTEQRFVAIVY